MRWEVRINGDVRDLKELRKSLNTNELRLIETDGEFYLQSGRFDSLETSEKVRTAALEMLPVLTGATRLALGGRKPLQVGAIAKVKEDGTRDMYIFAFDTMHVTDVATVRIEGSDGTVQVINPADKVPVWFRLGLTDQNVAKALRLFGTEEQDWVSLYRLYEVIEEDVGSKDKIADKGWATKSFIRRFKHTANSPGTVGDASRHGKEPSMPPTNPMDLSEARSMVEVILHNWLRSKLSL